jgi:circadian clock protein KaiC
MLSVELRPVADARSNGRSELPKSATGIQGLDEITGGGFPKGRPTLVCGNAGCGKTLMAMEFLVRGAMEMDEPGVFMAFEETAEDLASNVRSLGFDLEKLADENKLLVDHVHIERSEIDETGEYDLEGLFIRLGLAIDTVGARRVVLDTIEALFSGFSNTSILRAELRRLFHWLKDRGVTAVITAERGDGQLTRQGLEEYVSDCVILLDHRVDQQVSTRRLRIVKYRGSSHGTNEYPFLIGDRGISVLPITSVELTHTASDERVSSGVGDLDAMLGGEGFYRGSSILVSGTAGTGKTSLAGHFADATCRRGERCLYFAFEESPNQIARNLRSIGLDLEQWIDRDLLRIHATRPTLFGVETHLAAMHYLIDKWRPDAVVVDPISNFVQSSSLRESHAMLLRLVDYLKQQGITALLVNLACGGTHEEATEAGISSIIDTWILLRDIELGGERNRGIYVLKSRGMAHSNQIREFLLTDRGIKLQEVYVGPSGVLTGSMRVAQEAAERASELAQREDGERRRRELERRRRVVHAQIAALQAELDAEEEELRIASKLAEARVERTREQRQAMIRSRRASAETIDNGVRAAEGGPDD